jgi:hypothetical protein
LVDSYAEKGRLEKADIENGIVTDFLGRDQDDCHNTTLYHWYVVVEHVVRCLNGYY